MLFSLSSRATSRRWTLIQSLVRATERWTARAMRRELEASSDSRESAREILPPNRFPTFDVGFFIGNGPSPVSLLAPLRCYFFSHQCRIGDRSDRAVRDSSSVGARNRRKNAEEHQTFDEPKSNRRRRHRFQSYLAPLALHCCCCFPFSGACARACTRFRRPPPRAPPWTRPRGPRWPKSTCFFFFLERESRQRR